MSLDKINKLVDSVAKVVEDSEKLAIPLLSVKLNKLAESHPWDSTIVNVSRILSKAASNNKVFISKGEFRDLYNKMYSRNTKFAEFFGDELGQVEQQVAPTMYEKHVAPIADTYTQIGDPILANALNSAFDKTIPLKMYSQNTGKQAVFAVGSNLDAWNIKASKLEVDGGNEHVVVVRADYDTPKGVTSFLVPVEVKSNKVLDPTFFLSNEGVHDMNHVNIKKYLTTHAGTKLAIRSDTVVQVAAKAFSSGQSVSDVELAVTRLNATKENQGPFFADQIISQTIPAPVKNAEVTLPKSGQFKSFEEKFASPVGIANFKFGVDKVNIGRDSVAKTLYGFGMKNSQITVLGVDENTIVYGVSLDGKVAFKVPVKFANNRITNPDVMICNGSVSTFSKENVNRLFSKNEIDFKVAAATSPLYGLKPNDLVDNVRQAMAEGNYSKAEDALNVLANSENTQAYKTAFVIYTNGLSLVKSAEQDHTCSLVVKSSTSKHPVCGHTGLPLHKVFQDKHGNCQPLYRKDMDDTYEGAYFMNSKIFG